MAKREGPHKRPPEKTEATARERRGGGFRQAASGAKRTFVQAASSHGFAQPEVITHWEEIVGPALAGRCQPVKVGYSSGRTLGATLTVFAEGPIAPEIEHLAPQIIDRINTHCGWRAVSRLKVTQARVAGGFGEPPAPFTHDGMPSPASWRGVPRPEAPVLGSAAEHAAELASVITNPALRAALTRMGAYVLSRKTPAHATTPGADPRKRRPT